MTLRHPKGNVKLGPRPAGRSQNPWKQGFNETLEVPDGQVAQLVEQRTENPCVGGSIPPLATKYQRLADSNVWRQCQICVDQLVDYLGAVG